MRRGLIIAAVTVTVITLIILAAILAYSIRPAVSKSEYVIDKVTYPVTYYTSVKAASGTIEISRKGIVPDLEEIYVEPYSTGIYLIFKQAGPCDQSTSTCGLQDYLNKYGGLLICIKVTDTNGKLVYYQCKVFTPTKVYFYNINTAQEEGVDTQSWVQFNARRYCCHPPGPPGPGGVALVKFALSSPRSNTLSEILPGYSISIILSSVPPPSKS